MKSLEELYNETRLASNTIIDEMPTEWGGDKGSTHTYINVYEKIFSSLRQSPLTLLEIGVMHGTSLRMWKKYFENSKIIGVDIRPHVIKYAEERIDIMVLNATIEADIQVLTKAYPKFDIIIDDGSHQTNDQINSFHLLYKHLNPGGYYIIEDIQNIDLDIDKFRALSANATIVDNRKEKQRYDDVLIIIKKPLENIKEFRGTNTIEHWNQKHIDLYEVNKPFDFSRMTELSYIKVANDIIQTNKDDITTKSILDVGCAVGKSTHYFKKNMPEFEVSGIDFSETAITAAKIKSPNVNFECVDFLKNPISKNYGVITMLEVIEHIQEGVNYTILNNILEHCEFSIISTVDTEDDCFGEHISHYKLDTFDKKGYNVIWKSYLDEIQMPNGIYHYMIFLIKGKL